MINDKEPYKIMKFDYKTRQEMYHVLSEPTDIIQKMNYVETKQTKSELIKSIINYFTKEVKDLIYPSKSYAVAIIYSELLHKHFGVPFYEALNDPGLLYNNDKYFKYYDIDKEIYDAVLSKISLNFDESLSQIAETIKYFNYEFYISKNQYF